jgi:hypothetical protein
MKKILAYTILIFLINSVKGTPQYKDLLIIKNDTFYIDSPIIETDSLFRKRWHNFMLSFARANSGCWGGTICTWNVINDSLFLTKMYSRCTDKEIPISTLEEGKKKIFAIWLTYTFDFPSGKLICGNILEKTVYGDILGRDWMMSFSDIQEYDNVIVIDQGKVLEFTKFDNSKTRPGDYETWKQVYEEVDKCLDIYTSLKVKMEFNLIFEINDNGQIINPQIKNLQDTLISDEVKNDIINALSEVKGLPAYFRYGKPSSRRFDDDFVIY